MVGIQVSFSAPIKCQVCGQYVENNLTLLHISTDSAEIIFKLSNTNTPLIRSYNTVPRNNPDNNTEPTSLEFKQNCARLLSSLGHISSTIRHISEAADLLLSRSKIALSIIRLQVSKTMPDVENTQSATGIFYMGSLAG